MLKEVIELQEKAVNEVIAALATKNEVTFKAPTGSGKTVMMSNIMNKMLEQDPSLVFVVSCLSKGNLAKQNFETFERRKSYDNPLINPYLIKSDSGSETGLYIDDGFNVYVLPRDLYKEKSILARGTLQNFLDKIKKDHEIILIRDECHQATKNLDSLDRDYNYFSKRLDISATPKLAKRTFPDVEITEREAMNVHLIKDVVYESDSDPYQSAINKYTDIKKQYLEYLGINPCLIIQVSTKEKADEEILRIKKTLNDKYSDLKYMIIMDKEANCETNDKISKLKISQWKDYAKQNNATIDIIIFKMVITEGWDIPRACMLFQVRDSKSKILDEQVIGRVRRNPRLLDFEKLSKEAQKLATTAYVWGIKDTSKTTRDIVVKLSADKETIQNEFKLETTRLKPLHKLKNLDIKNVVKNFSDIQNPPCIFDLYKSYDKASDTLKNMFYEQLSNFQEWKNASLHVDELENELKNIVCNYDTSLEVFKDENGNVVLSTIPEESSFVETINNKDLNNWIWNRVSNKEHEKFSFDSQAEEVFAQLLKTLTENKYEGSSFVKSIEFTKGDISRDIYLVGKNYIENSQIKFEYFNHGIHSSYPDFILKDTKDNLHLFEVKSTNKASDASFDEDEYLEKIEMLKKGYKASSKLVPYSFYIPLLEGECWHIFKYKDGYEKEYFYNSEKDSISIVFNILNS